MTYHRSLQPRLVRSAVAVTLSFAIFALTGCAAKRAVSKAEPTAFLNSTGTAGAGKISRLPYERSWRNPSVKVSNYSRICFRPVTTAYLRAEMWQQSASPFITSKEDFILQAAGLAQTWNASLRNAFAVPENRFAVVNDATQPGTLVVEIAITEVVFGRPVANAASYAVSGGGVAYGALFSPSVAFEARVTDGATGQLVATVSDRRSTKIKLVDLSKFTYTQSNRQICEQWSGEFMKAFNVSLFPKVNRSYFGLF